MAPGIFTGAGTGNFQKKIVFIAYDKQTRFDPKEVIPSNLGKGRIFGRSNLFCRIKRNLEV